jgi:hypothetical protein
MGNASEQHAKVIDWTSHTVDIGVLGHLQDFVLAKQGRF